MTKTAFRGRSARGGIRHIIKTLLVMKLTVLLCTAFSFQAAAHSYGQSVTFSGTNVSLEKAFAAVRKQTGYVFFYDRELIKNAQPVNIHAVDLPLKQFLDKLFVGQGLAYTIVSKSIVLSKAAVERQVNSAFDIVNAAPPLSGRIVDAEGKPLAGATITIKKSKVSTITNEDGRFTINVNVGDVLVISFVGFSSKEITVTSENFKDGANLQVALSLATTALEAVTVHTGYQDLPKDRSTGSYYKIDNELLRRKVSSTVLDRIFDVTNGLVYTRTVGGDGAVFTESNGLPALQIRGASTINANKAPLVVVDNFPYNGPLDNLNPNDVESITILKDAAAASIWGINSGNGVIVINTKKGSFNQRTNITVNSNLTIGGKPDLFYIPVVSSADVIEVERKRFADSIYNIYDDLGPSLGIFPQYSQVIEILLAARKGHITKAQADDAIAELVSTSANAARNDIKKYLLQNKINQQYALNISGGAAEYRYYASIGYDVLRPTEVGRSDKRLTLRMNSTWKPVRSLEITGEINYIQGVNVSRLNDYADLLPIGGTRAPYTRLADDNGNALAIPHLYRLAYVDTATYPALLDWHYRPLDELNHNESTARQNDIRFIGGLKYHLIPGLDVGMTYQYQKSNSSTVSISKPNSFRVRNGVNTFMDIVGGQVVYPWPMGSAISTGIEESKSWNFRVNIKFERNWGEHDVSAIGGIETRESSFSSLGSTVIGYDEELAIVPVVDYLTLLPSRPGGDLHAIGQNVVSMRIDDNLLRNGSYFTNIGYTYKGRYLFTASARVDRANLFGVKANQRQVPLWSSGVGWIVSKETFCNLAWLSNLKLRITYGYNGNASTNASAYPTISYLAGGPSSGRPAPYYAYILTPNNPQLRWEKIRMLNIGLDLGLWNDRLGFSIEYYYKRGIDLLGAFPTDPTAGWSSYISNFASIKGKGIDIALDVQNIKKPFQWKTNLNFSYNTDKVTDYGGQENLIASNLVEGFPVQVGYSLYAFNSYRWAGLDPTNGEPRIYLADTISNFNNYSQGKSSDIVHHGSRSPRIFGNIINTFAWKDFSLSFNLTYKFVYFFRRSSYFGDLSNETGLSGHSDYIFRWQKPGDEVFTNVPSDGGDGRYAIYGRSDVLAERGDHVRFQDVRIGYSIKKIKKVPFQTLQLYLYAQNLGLIWTANKKGIDPEAPSFGSMPIPRSFSLGITMSY